MLSNLIPVGTFLSSVPKALLLSRLLSPTQPQQPDNTMKDADNITLDMSAIEGRQIPFAQLHNLVERMRYIAPGERVGYGDLDGERTGNTIKVTAHIERASTSTKPEDLT